MGTTIQASNKKSGKEKSNEKLAPAPRSNETEIGKDSVDRITRKPTFDYYSRPTVGTRFFIFKYVGDEIAGKIIGHAISNVRRNSSYPIRLSDGEVVEIFANRHLHKLIKAHSLVFARVRIVLVGRDHNSWGHAAKVYRVFRVNGPDETLAGTTQEI